MNFFNVLSISDTLSSTWEKFAGAVTSFQSIKDVIDILFVALIIYTLIIQLRKTQSIQILKGVALVLVLYMLVNLFEMNASKYIFKSVFSDILVILVIIFSGEIRQTLEKVGQRKNFSLYALFSSNKNDQSDEFETINCVCRACSEMSEDKIGSLIVFQRESLLGDLTKHSVHLDALVTTEMLCSIFFPKAALHDGAIVIDGSRIVAARCIVPLKNEKEVKEHVGTRHRAALEVSLHSDAVAVVTSEETGIISVACDGQMKRGLTDAELREILINLLIESTPEENGKKVRRRLKLGKKNKEEEAETHEE